MFVTLSMSKMFVILERSQDQPTQQRKSPNFTDDENIALAEAVRDRFHLLLGNQSAQTTPARRRELWMEVVRCVNAVSTRTRTLTRVKKRWADLKLRARQKQQLQREHWCVFFLLKNNILVK